MIVGPSSSPRSCLYRSLAVCMITGRVISLYFTKYLYRSYPEHHIKQDQFGLSSLFCPLLPALAWWQTSNPYSLCMGNELEALNRIYMRIFITKLYIYVINGYSSLFVRCNIFCTFAGCFFNWQYICNNLFYLLYSSIKKEETWE
jgi:hypothetical protein